MFLNTWVFNSDDFSSPPHVGYGVGVRPTAQGHAGCVLPAGPGGGALGLSAPAVRLSGLGRPSQGEGAGLRGRGRGKSKRHSSPLSVKIKKMLAHNVFLSDSVLVKLYSYSYYLILSIFIFKTFLYKMDLTLLQ